ncbi:MAG TPA: hypothetical protein VFW39_12475, partial [Sphingomicrobium sp.]|nr:hypothetical protein [Sphingomicrobium sp.]
AWDLTRWLVEIAGWGGALLILLAYLLLSAGRLTGQSLSYQAMNVVGAAGFVINGWWHGAIPSAALNVMWLLIGAIASIGILRRRERGLEPVGNDRIIRDRVDAGVNDR